MERSQKVKKGFRAFFNRNQRTQSLERHQEHSRQPVSSERATMQSIIDESGDRQRTRARYVEAAKLLEEAVKGTWTSMEGIWFLRPHWGARKLQQLAVQRQNRKSAENAGKQSRRKDLMREMWTCNSLLLHCFQSVLMNAPYLRCLRLGALAPMPWLSWPQLFK
jgi:hypothetical protein